MVSGGSRLGTEALTRQEAAHTTQREGGGREREIEDSKEERRGEEENGSG